MSTIYRILLVAFCLLTIDTPLSAQWKPTNGPFGGDVNVLTSNNTHIFAGTWGGVYRSTDNGDNWSSVNNGLSCIEISALAINDSIIYAGTYAGIFRSENYGNNWVKINSNLTNTNIHAIAIKNNNLFAGTDNGVFRSIDEGTSWTQVNAGLTGHQVKAFAICGNSLFVVTEAGISRSTNNGISWSYTNSGIPSNQVITLTVSGTTIFAGTVQGVFISIDNGTSWNSIDDGINYYCVRSLTMCNSKLYIGTDNGLYISSFNGVNWITVCADLPASYIKTVTTNGINVFVGYDSGIYRTSNDGLSWSETNNGMNNFCAVSLVTKENELFANVLNKGVYRSSNNGQSWLPASNGLNKEVLSFAVDEDNLFAGTINGGFYSFNFLDSIWIATSKGFTDANINVITVSDTNIFVGTDIAGIFRSSDNGISWVQINSGLLYPNVSAIVKNGSTIFALVEHKLYISNNNGDDWSIVNTGQVERIRNLYSSNGYLFAEKYLDLGLYRSSDNGLSWSAITNGLTGYNFRAFAASGANLFIASAPDDVHISIDYGLNWREITTGLINFNPILSIAANNSHLFVGTNVIGIWARPLTEMVSNSVSGLISENTTWSDSVKVVGNITISDGIQLDIQPGSKIVFTGNYDITVKGRINALGTADRKIKFSPNLTNDHWQGILYPENFDNDSSTYNHCIFQNSQSGGNGGVFNVQKGNRVVVADCVAEDNKSFNNGGFICANQSNIVIINSAIRRNFAQMAGGALYLENCTQTLINNTFNNNLALSTGGAIVFNNTDGNVFNSIFWANSAANNSQISLTDNNSDPNFYNNNIQGGILAITGDGSGANFSGSFSNNINFDPQFANDSFGYNLSSTSPCINKGLQSKEKLFLPISDINGNPRVISGNVDIGANEFNPTDIYNYMNIYDCELEQNYPNPFNPETVISYSIKEGFNGLVKLKIYNTKGEIVQTIINNVTKAGHYNQVFNGSKLSSGIYYYGIEAGDFKQMKKMVMVK